jgi:hypothetical protein
MDAIKIEKMVNQSISEFGLTPNEIRLMIKDHAKSIIEARNWYEGQAYIQRIEYLTHRIAAYTEALAAATN